MNELEVIKDRIATNIKDCTISVTCGDVCGSRLCILCVHGKERVVVMRVDEETIDKLISFLEEAKKLIKEGD